MNINDKFMTNYLNLEENNHNNKNCIEKEAKEENKIKIMILDNSKIFLFRLRSIFTQIECLSLQNNFIKDITFLKNLPNLYYLDLLGNHINNFKPLTKHGTFGFLSITPTKTFTDKKYINLKQLNIVILQVKIEEKSVYNNLIVGNPNIFVLNNDIIDFNKKVKICNTVLSLRYYIHNLLSDNEEMKMLKNSNQDYNNIKNKKKEDSISVKDILLEKKLKIYKGSATNSKCIEIINFFEEYNKALFNIFKSQKLKYNEEILWDQERKKLLLIYKTLEQISKYFSLDSQNYEKLIQLNKDGINKNMRDYSLKYPYIDLKIFRYLEFPQYKELALSVILLYLLSIFSKEISLYLILLMFKKTKYYHESENNKSKINNNIKSLFSIKKIYLFSYYYTIYDLLLDESKENNDNENIYNIKNRLNMLSITDKIYDILSYEEIFIRGYNANENVSQKNKIIIKDFIGSLYNMKIFPQVFNIFHFVNDFLIYNKLYSELDTCFPKDIHFFCEVHGLLLNYYNKYHEIKESMADLKYDKIQNSCLLGNKFYFSKGNITEKSQFLFHNRKVFHPNKKKIEKMENIKSPNDLRKEREKMMKQKFINNALEKYLIITTQKRKNKNPGNYKCKLNSNFSNKKYFINDNHIIDKFYKTCNFSKMKLIKRNIDFNFNNSFEKTKTFSNPFYLYSQSNPRKIKPLKTNNTFDKNMENRKEFFNNYYLSNHFNSNNNNFTSFRSNLNELSKNINSRYVKENKNLLTLFDGNNENEKELKQYSLTINKKNKTLSYKIKEFSKQYIVSNHFNPENGKFMRIKKNSDSVNSNIYKKTRKLFDLMLLP